MGQNLIRDLDDSALERLRDRAREMNIPMERLIRDAIHDLVRPTRQELFAEADRLREKISSVSDDSTRMIREDRDNR